MCNGSRRNKAPRCETLSLVFMCVCVCVAHQFHTKSPCVKHLECNTAVGALSTQESEVSPLKKWHTTMQCMLTYSSPLPAPAVLPMRMSDLVQYVTHVAPAVIFCPFGHFEGCCLRMYSTHQLCTIVNSCRLSDPGFGLEGDGEIFES